MDPLIYCPVEDCEADPTMVLDIRVYVNDSPVPMTWVCQDHYDAITVKPKEWQFTHSWDEGLVVRKSP